MVSHSHLSAGNSNSSQSRDLFAEFGVSRPNSPSLSSPLVLSCEDIVESDAVPQSIPASSDESTSLDKEFEVTVGPPLSSEAKDIFKAAHYFSIKDRDEALLERKKNLQLMSYLTAHGVSINDVQAFVSDGKMTKVSDAQKVFAKSPQPTAATGLPLDGTSAPSFLGGHLVLVTCVGEREFHTHLPTSADVPAAGTVSDKKFFHSNPNINAGPISPLEVGEIPIKQGESSKSWTAIVSKNAGKSNRSLSFHPPILEDGNFLVKPPVEVLRRGNQRWSSSLVGYFLHSTLPFKVVEPIARRLWGSMGLSKVFLHSKGYYIFKFASASDRDNVLASGPWHFASKIMVLQKWQEGVEFAKTECYKFPVWVKISNIPLSYWSDEGISYIASAIGKPLFTDELTNKNDLLNFARVCIEINASYSFPSSIKVVVFNEEQAETVTVPVEVEYQSRPPACPSCKVFGHSPLKCPKANYQWVPKTQPAAGLPKVIATSPSVCPAPDGCLDPKSAIPNDNGWVTVSRGAKSGQDPLPPSSPMASTNYFSPIAVPGDPMASPDTATPTADNPLTSKLKLIDEKEVKDLKHKQGSDSDSTKAAKKRKGKGKVGNPSF